jgi:hypothetical protein
MTDYRIESATKEEWAERALRAEANAMKASNAALLEKRRADEAEAKLMNDDLQNRYMIERLRIAIERAEAAEDRIEELEEKLKAAIHDAREAEAYVEELEATLKDTAWAVWTQFKNWDAEKKFALREVVKYLKEKGNVDTAVFETDGR